VEGHAPTDRVGGPIGAVLSDSGSACPRRSPAKAEAPAGIKPGRPSVEPSLFWLAVALAVFLVSGLAWLIWFKPYLALSMGISGACALSVTAIIRELAGDR
jgi:hypothetical protein